MNQALFFIIYNLSSNPLITKLALFLSYPFAYGLIIILILWVIFFSKRKMYNFSLLFLSGLTSWLVAATLKNILQFKRPFLNLDIVPLYNETGFSFPSEHMAVFTALAISMFLINRRTGFIFLIIAILIGLSRIILGVHYPVDILGGFVVGLICSLIFTEIYKKI
jgi:undecaprenyl-diphosphatase